MIATWRHCIIWHSFYVLEEWTWVIYLSNVLSIKRNSFQYFRLLMSTCSDSICENAFETSLFCFIQKFQRVDYYTAWSNLTKFVEKRDLPNHGQTCGHRFPDVIWRIPNPNLTKSQVMLNTSYWPPLAFRSKFVNDHTLVSKCHPGVFLGPLLEKVCIMNKPFLNATPPVRNCTLAVHERVDCRFLVLPGR